MTSLLKTLGIDEFSVEQQLQLVEEVWDNIATSVADEPIPQSHQELLDRRLAAHEASPQAGYSWEEVRASLRRPSGAAG